MSNIIYRVDYFKNYFFAIKKKKRTIYLRKYTHTGIKSLIERFPNIPEGSGQDVDSFAENLTYTITNEIEKYFPLKERSIKYNPNPWITHELKKACRYKHKLYKKFVTVPTKENEQKFKTYRNKLTNYIAHVKKDYYRRIFYKNKSNSKQTWKNINQILGRNTRNSLPDCFIKENIMIKNPNEIANCFNTFFSNVGHNIAKELPTDATKSIETYMTDYNEKTLFLVPVTEPEVNCIISNFNAKTSLDYYGISMKFVRMLKDVLKKPLCALINLSFAQGKFPTIFKTALIHPIHKRGSQKEFTNYRPIALLPQLSKVLEKAFEKKTFVVY